MNASFLENADILIAADCVAYAYGNFHNDFMKDKITLIGCPKLDGDYSNLIADILRRNTIKSISIVVMIVPCCTFLLRATEEAITKSGKSFNLTSTTIALDGQIV